MWRCELTRPRPLDKCVQRTNVSSGAGTADATAGRTPTQNALVRQSIHTAHQTRQDCRADLSTAAAVMQARQAATQPPARPPTRSDVVRHAKCKQDVHCCTLLNLSFFTKRHTPRVTYRPTVQTLPDGRFTPPDTTQTAVSCWVWRVV